MCHYTGTVAGKKGSRVTISVCDDAGINSLIETESSTPRSNPSTPTLGAWTIWDLTLSTTCKILCCQTTFHTAKLCMISASSQTPTRS
jgi:hypothetical protein